MKSSLRSSKEVEIWKYSWIESFTERRIYPAINLPKSGTRKDDLLYHPDEFKRIGMLRRQLAQRPGGEAMEVLIDHIQNSSSNAELLLTGLR